MDSRPNSNSKVEAEGPTSETVVWEILVSLLPVLDYVASSIDIADNIILRQSDGKPC